METIQIIFIVYRCVESALFLSWFSSLSLILIAFYSKRYGILSILSVVVYVIYIVEVMIFDNQPIRIEGHNRWIMDPVLKVFSCLSILMMTFSAIFAIAEKRAEPGLSTRVHSLRLIFLPVIIYAVILCATFAVLALDEILTAYYSFDRPFMIWMVVKDFLETLVWTIGLLFLSTALGRELYLETVNSQEEISERVLPLQQQQQNLLGSRKIPKKKPAKTTPKMYDTIFILVSIAVANFAQIAIVFMMLINLLVQDLEQLERQYDTLGWMNWVRVSLTYFVNLFLAITTFRLFQVNCINRKKSKMATSSTSRPIGEAFRNLMANQSEWWGESFNNSNGGSGLTPNNNREKRKKSKNVKRGGGNAAESESTSRTTFTNSEDIMDFDIDFNLPQDDFSIEEFMNKGDFDPNLLGNKGKNI